MYHQGELWGTEGENGEWTGMVGRLARGEADMGVANLFLTLTRRGAVDYSAPYDAEVKVCQNGSEGRRDVLFIIPCHC